MCKSVYDVDVRQIRNLNKNATNCHGNIFNLSFYEEMDTVIFRDTIVLIWYLHCIGDERNLLQNSSNVYQTYHEWGMPSVNILVSKIGS
jgi:hypothetical protein